MSDWGKGYVTDVPYRVGYYPHQSPAHLDLACLLNSVQGLRAGPDEPLSYLELGCGHGLGAMALAASNPGWRITAIDFNPAHVAGATALAAEIGLANVSFLEADLATLAEEALSLAIPDADVVSMHGVWSWVSAPVRRGIVRLLRAKVRAGGIVHVSYNALPAWQNSLGVQRVLREAGRRLAWRSDRQAGAGLGVVQTLRAANAVQIGEDAYAIGLNPQQDRTTPEYLAHEYMNAGWSPCFHADVAEAMADAKLEWVGSANLLENFPALTMSEAVRAVHDRFEDPVMRELIKDSSLTRGLRQDVFVRGPRSLDAAARDAALSDVTLALLCRPEDVAYEFDVPIGRASLGTDFYRPMVQALGAAPQRVGDLFAAARPGAGRGSVAELVGVLVGMRMAVSVAGQPRALRPEPERFNSALARRMVRSGWLEYSVGLATSGLGTPVIAQVLEVYAYARMREDVEPDTARWAADLAGGDDAAYRSRVQSVLDRIVTERGPVWRQLRMV